MRLQLPSGREVHVGVRHITLTTGRHRVQRATEVRCKLAEGPALAEEAVCSNTENFCRRTGRRLASIRLLYALKLGVGFLAFNKADRRAVFTALNANYVERQPNLVIDDVFDLIDTHGTQEGLEAEAADLDQCLRAALRLLTPRQKRRFLTSDAVRTLVEVTKE